MVACWQFKILIFPNGQQKGSQQNFKCQEFAFFAIFVNETTVVTS
jgi:hypothetical protein